MHVHQSTCSFGTSLYSFGETGGEIIPALHKLVPIGGEPLRGDLLRLPGGLRMADLAGEVAAWRDGGDVGSVVDEDGVEDVPGFADVGGVGDDVDPVLVAPAGHRDVQAAVRGRRRDEGEGDVDGVALVAVFGRRVPQADMLAAVVGGQRDGAVSTEMGHGQRTVGMGSDDGPPVAAAYRFTPLGAQAAVVAARRDDLADTGVFTATDRDGDVRGEVTDGEPHLLDRVVERVDVIVRRRNDGDGLAVDGMAEPVASDPLNVVGEGAGGDPAVGFVAVQH